MRTLLTTAIVLVVSLGAISAPLGLAEVDAVSLAPAVPSLGPPLPIAAPNVAPELPLPAEAALVPAIPASAPAPTPPPREIALPPPTVVGATAAGGAILALVGFALYSRLSRHQLLDHKRRDEIFGIIKVAPGVSLTSIAERTGLGWGTAVYHLERLEKGGFVASERAGGRRSYYPVGLVPKDARASLGALQQDTTRTVATYVATRPGATQTEVADALGLTASAASKQVSKLENAGLVRRERDWKTVRLHPEPKLADLLKPTERSVQNFPPSRSPVLA